ncbi:MAG TPA: GNAT family N-acetyltransferase [Bryobacteraceae bacterium]|nr:GNAT family N-acetyltransferase [Bryobacteraceae bacterium]
MGVNGSPARDYFLTSERLGFGHWSTSDLMLAQDLWGNAEVTSLIGGPFADEQIEQRLSREIACMSACNVQYWPVFLLENDQHAGCAGLRPYRLDRQIYELGFHLRPEYWGRGLAQEAGRAVIAFAFEKLGAEALFAGHHPANSASRRVLAKLGFQFTHDEFYPPTGLTHRSYLLTRRDYSRG